MLLPTWARLPSLSALEHGAFVAMGLLAYVLITRIGQQRRHPSAAIAWVIGIAAFPYLALPLFLVFGSRKVARPARRTALCSLPGAPAALSAPAWATRLMAGLGIRPAALNRSVAFHADGAQAYAALIDLLDEARHELVVGTFLLADDGAGQGVARRLGAAARRGVRVRLLVDSIGSLKTSPRLLQSMGRDGVELRRFMPLLHNPMRGRTNLRNHRKLAVADGQRLWSGGRNLADEYFFDRPGRVAWADLSFVVDGPLAAQALAQFERDWSWAGGRAVQAMPELAPAAPSVGAMPAQWVPSGPDHADDTVHALLLAGAWHAQERILAATPYFVPDEALLDAWCMTCRRGVAVRLVVPGRSNHRLADWARENALRRLSAAGAQVLLAPSMVHAKLVVFDRTMALCGSANLDGRSLFLNYEAMAVSYGPMEVDWLADWHARLAGEAQGFDASVPPWWRDVAQGVVRAVGFQL